MENRQEGKHSSGSRQAQGCHVTLQPDKAHLDTRDVGLSPVFTLADMMKRDRACSTFLLTNKKHSQPGMNGHGVLCAVPRCMLGCV